MELTQTVGSHRFISLYSALFITFLSTTRAVRTQSFPYSLTRTPDSWCIPFGSLIACRCHGRVKSRLVIVSQLSCICQLSEPTIKAMTRKILKMMICRGLAFAAMQSIQRM
ncbi:hypothetical protein B0H66DRAFT_197585 [Apodospora peruviana]|uniref:Uncharacterized protein n=1 Tax=Apodospora peruviana TaxID=516989 RepID=A0AAE0IC40_9PEZI|nr:hypothetical protein B0H66DRAFT_197585 [Apodospora peruviana]